MSIIGRVTDNSGSQNSEDEILIIREEKNLNLVVGTFKGFIIECSVDESIVKKYKNVVILRADNLNSGDIIEVLPEKNKYRLLYKIKSDDNIILTTNKCNNNCIMCPDSIAVRNNNEVEDIERLKYIVSLMDKETKFLCITGGEPTLLKEGLFEILDCCKERLNYTEFVMLTNGRTFYYEKYVKLFKKHRPNNMIIGIPIHSNIEQVHDKITGVTNSYKQTIQGIKNLVSHKERVEIRVVINKFNYRNLKDISKLILEEFPEVYRVNFMAMEILGNAYNNVNDVWVDFDEIQEGLDEACIFLLKNGIRAYIYNMPLCYVNPNLWTITKKSISPHKVVYGENCERCKEINRCGGFFSSTKRFMKLKERVIL